MDTTLKNTTLAVEKKRFFFDFKENEKGRFLRITEEVRGMRDSIIIPSTGLREFAGILQEMMELEEESQVQPAVSVE